MTAPTERPIAESATRSKTEGASVMRYRKKPVEIEAMQSDGTLATANLIVDWAKESGGRVFASDFNPQRGTCDALSIVTLEGTMCADVGDWIIRGVKGEFYPCKPDIFEATYDEADQ